MSVSRAVIGDGGGASTSQQYSELTKQQHQESLQQQPQHQEIILRPSSLKPKELAFAPALPHKPSATSASAIYGPRARAFNRGSLSETYPRGAQHPQHQHLRQPVRTQQLVFGRLRRSTSPSHFRAVLDVSPASEERGEGDHDVEAEPVMELKRQLASTRQDLHFAKIQLAQHEQLLILTEASQLTRSISTSGQSNHAAGNSDQPGSPYRSSGSLNGLASRPSLNKELMQKLRSMTETIKMLSDENALLRGEKEALAERKHLQEAEKDTPGKANSHRNGDYEEMGKSDLISLVLSYDDKLKALTEEVVQLSKSRDEAQNKGADKDKYKALARRLKEERNQYKETCDEKKKEQDALKSEIEKMTEMIGELRTNCQTLQTELLETRSSSLPPPQPQVAQAHVAVQVKIEPQTHSSLRGSLPNVRKTSHSSTASTSDSTRRARAVYGVSAARQQHGPVKASTSSSTNSSAVSLRPSPMRASTVASRNRAAANAKPPAATAGAGPKIAKPVQKSHKKAAVTSTSSSPSPVMRKPVQAAVGSRIPCPSPSRIPRVKTSSASPQSLPVTLAVCPTPSPPPPPPPSQLPPEDAVDPTPPHKPVQPTSLPEKIITAAFDDDEEDDVLQVAPDGQILMTLGKKPAPVPTNPAAGAASSGSERLQPPVGRETDVRSCTSGDSNLSGDEEHRSADDEGSRDERDEEDDESDVPRRKVNAKDCSSAGVVEEEEDEERDSGVPETPRTSRRKAENLKQGIAARRIQRTWKHFYEELEERREQNPDAPISKLAEDSIERKAEAAKTAVTSQEAAAVRETIDRKYSLPANLNETVQKAEEEPEEESSGGDLLSIQAAINSHNARSKSLSTLRGTGGVRIQVARPWLKKKTPVVEESSEEELERTFSSLGALLRAHDKRQMMLQRLEADKDLFQTGKVSAMRAKFNERRKQAAAAAGGVRSDGITDDDEDVVY